MKIFEEHGNVIIENASSFDLGQIFDCGQCFRWEENNGKFCGIAFGKKLTVYSFENKVYFENITLEEFENIWKDYFDFSFDYETSKKEFAKISPVLKEACGFCPGIRILKQEPWETLCSFIISQNNNIPRIKKIISRLCENFGEKIDGGYAFPTASKIASLSEEDLSVIKSGFRAKYILDAAKKVNSGEVNLQEISKMEIEDARAELMKINGVGPKVAECVLLYGMHRLGAFPIDVWVKKIMGTLFKGQTPEIFGPRAGIAQQYLYHYTRTNPHILQN